ncbi:MAG: nucleotidyltransferase family protein [Sporomusaceae bacterium]|nr:nucleotidyltransferase family protein [Sporomusaceae bacterium]
MVTGVILAAGQGRRMGQPKQLLPLGGKPMVWHVAAAACQAALDQVVVITGSYHAEVKEVLEDLPLQVLYNENWAQGQATSVKKAVQSVRDEAGAILFLLADQPLVDIELINKLVGTYRETGTSIIMPRWHSQPGNPVLFDMKVWRSALLQLSGDEGARQIIKQQQQKAVHYIELSDGQAFFDVDTQSEYDKIQKLWQVLKKS